MKVYVVTGGTFEDFILGVYTSPGNTEKAVARAKKILEENHPGNPGNSVKVEEYELDVDNEFGFSLLS